ncbi:DUF7350 domain-containing protein [Halorubrum luteum]
MTNDTPTTRIEARRNEESRGCLSRRRLLSASATAFATVGIAGCSDDEGMSAGDADASDAEEPDAGADVDPDDVLPDLPRVENPPDAVYVPTHREAMVHLPTERAGEYAVTPMLTYPHRFWLVTGDRTEEVVPESARGVHLMFTPWDPETGTVLPVDAGAQIRVRHEGDVIDQRAPWPMISQSMGFHFGDNVPLPEDGTYTVEVDLTSVPTRTTGAFDGRFEAGGTATFEFEYAETLRQGLIDDVHYFDEALWGERGAIDPMDHGEHDGHDEDGENHHHDEEMEMMMPFSRLPEAQSYPGVGLGEPRTGDARVVVRYLQESRLVGGDDYLFVSPRTPYNRVPLADTAIAVDGAVSGALEQTLDDELGLHYGIAASLAPGDTVEVVFESPPQVSRHAGYETAFLDMPPVEVTVPE